jgi:hypothetical protein
VTPEGSTHVDTFTGTTSSVSRTASGKLAVVAVVRQRVCGPLRHVSTFVVRADRSGLMSARL